MKIKTYSELIKLKTYEERVDYLKLNSVVGDDTFGFDRYLNQMFYKSEEWKNIRNYIISRDNGCDLGIKDREIIGEKILVHHMNPISKDDIINKNDMLLNPNHLICTSKMTHDIIHYGKEQNKPPSIIERSKDDTSPWKVRRDTNG